LCGFVRGLEIGASAIGRTSTVCDAVESLRERALQLSEFHDDFNLGVSLGIPLAMMIASEMLG